MKECLKLALAVVLLSIIGANLGLDIAYFFGSPDIEHGTEKGATYTYGRQGYANFELPHVAGWLASTAQTQQDTHAANTKNPTVNQTDDSIWVILQGLSAPVAAFFALVLLCVGYGQLRAIHRQGNIAESQVGLVRDEFLASHRPKIRVKHIWFKNDIWHGDPISMRMTIGNVGSAPADIFQCRMRTEIVPTERGLQFPPNPELEYKRLCEPILRIGHSAEIDPNVEKPLRLSSDDNVALRNGAKTLFCFGHIEYKPVNVNAADGIHTTCFCRRLVLRENANVDERGRFCVVDDPDYEYQD